MEHARNGRYKSKEAVQPNTRNPLKSRVLFEIEENPEYMPEFNGVRDPMEAMMCIDRMETLFDAIDCSEEDKVVYAATKLRSKALCWWKMVKDRSGPQTPTKLTWSEFKELFKQEFRPIMKVMKIVGEFFTIKMGFHETISQYISRFEKYLWFVKCHVTFDEIKICLFVRGLTDSIRDRITEKDMTTFEKAVQAALTIESLQNMLPLERRNPMIGTGHGRDYGSKGRW